MFTASKRLVLSKKKPLFLSIFRKELPSNRDYRRWKNNVYIMYMGKWMHFFEHLKNIICKFPTTIECCVGVIWSYFVQIHYAECFIIFRFFSLVCEIIIIGINMHRKIIYLHGDEKKYRFFVSLFAPCVIIRIRFSDFDLN